MLLVVKTWQGMHEEDETHTDEQSALAVAEAWGNEGAEHAAFVYFCDREATGRCRLVREVYGQ